MARSMTAAVTNGRAASCTRITDACADTAAKPSATESCRRAPPVTTRCAVVVAGIGGSVAPGGTTMTISVTRGMGIEGGDGALEERPPVDRQPLLGHAGAEARAVSARRDDHRHAHEEVREYSNRAVSAPPAKARTRSAVSATARR